MRPGLRTVAGLGFWGMVDPDHVPFVDDRSRIYGALEQPRPSDRPYSLRNGDPLDVRGWVAIRQRTDPPTCVLLTDGQAGVLARALNIPERIRHGRDKESLLSTQVQWSVAIPASLIARGDSILRAWIYDRSGRRFVKLEGQELVSNKR